MGRPEDSRVKIPALVHFTRLGYSYFSIKSKIRGKDYHEDTNIFYDIFSHAINRINNTKYTIDDCKKIIEKLSEKLDNEDLGRAFYNCLLNGIDGVQLIDFKDWDNNNFSVVTELPYENGDDNFRPDIIVLINGMPLAFCEVKRQNNKDGIIAERNRMLSRFSNKAYRRFANITQFTVFSNNQEYDDTDIEPIQGSYYASSSYSKMFFSKFREQQKDYLNSKIDETDSEIAEFILRDNNLLSIKYNDEYLDNLDVNTPTNRIITSLFSKERIMFILKYGLCYKQTTDKKGITQIEKHIMRYPQLFATLAIREKLEEGVTKGVIWHTQGSGKTALAYSNVRFLKDYYQSKGKISKVYFIVDRLDLARQAKAEFEARGLHVNLVDSKDAFVNDIKSVTKKTVGAKDTITVVNIQKFSTESITKKSDYDVNVQRIYFIDEAHRSFDPKGSFLANLFASDRDSVKIALTGTPLLKKNAETKLIFGDYIHKYYYNESIADGYTLRLIREDIEATYKNKLQDALSELKVKLGNVPRDEAYAHEKFVAAMVEYISADFLESRLRMDDSIGAMIVCDSSKQARELYAQLSAQGLFNVALVLHDEGTKQEKADIQKNFKKGIIDILIVYNMLLTGFDAPRLKKMYLARFVRAHNMLQTLTRVNRPYKDFHYGYVVDFVNIEHEFNKTNEDYFRELSEDIQDSLEFYNDIFKQPDDIKAELDEIQNKLFTYDIDNVNHFVTQISSIDDKKELLALRKVLENYKSLFNLCTAFGFDDIRNCFTIEKAQQLLSEVSKRIDIVNLKQSLADADNLRGILNVALDQIDFRFRKVGEEELVIADEFQKALEKTRYELKERNLDPKDPQYVTLLEELKRIFDKKNLLDIEELTTEEMKEMIKTLDDIRKRAAAHNRKDQMLADKYNGDVKFMRAHKRIMETPPPIGNDVVVHRILMKVKGRVDDIVSHAKDVLKNENYFIGQVKPIIMATCTEEHIRPSMSQITFINNNITREYFDERNGAA